MSGRKCATGVALRTVLEERLRRIAREEAVDLQRLRRQMAFDRFLARLFSRPGSPWVRKRNVSVSFRVSKSPGAARSLPKAFPLNHFACVSTPSNIADTLRCCTWGAQRFFEVLPALFVNAARLPATPQPPSTSRLPALSVSGAVSVGPPTARLIHINGGRL